MEDGGAASQRPTSFPIATRPAAPMRPIQALQRRRARLCARRRPEVDLAVRGAHSRELFCRGKQVALTCGPGLWVGDSHLATTRPRLCVEDRAAVRRAPPAATRHVELPRSPAALRTRRPGEAPCPAGAVARSGAALCGRPMPSLGNGEVHRLGARKLARRCGRPFIEQGQIDGPPRASSLVRSRERGRRKPTALDRAGIGRTGVQAAANSSLC